MGTAERKEREKQHRREEILAAAENVFFAKGFLKATMDDIAKEAELSKGTLYLYFKSKDDLHIEISRKAMIILKEQTTAASEGGGSSIEKLQRMGWAAIRFGENHPKHMQAILTMDEIQKESISIDAGGVKEMLFKGSTVGTVLQIIEEGIAKGDIRSDISPVLVAHTLWMSVISVLRFVEKKASLLEFLEIEPEMVFKSHFDVILNGITK